jgi:hypothetical protein
MPGHLWFCFCEPATLNPRLIESGAITDFPGRAACFGQPFREIRQPGFLLDANIRDGNACLEHFFALRAESHPNSEFSQALADRVRSHSKNTCGPFQIAAKAIDCKKRRFP